MTPAEAPLPVRRLPLRLRSDATRTIMRFFWVGQQRAQHIIDRVAALSDADARRLLDQTLADYQSQHENMDQTLADHAQEAMELIGAVSPSDRTRLLLIGSYFTMEYANEAAALFNPSMVAARDQSDAQPGTTRFFMSLRAIGEGHISSIVFRRGTITADGQVQLDDLPQHRKPVRIDENRRYDKKLFRVKIIEMGGYHPCVDDVLNKLDASFTFAQLRHTIENYQPPEADRPACLEACRAMDWLAAANYQITAATGDPSHFVLFPLSQTEAQGVEDMRLVRFTDDDGSVRYYGTYTAFSGRECFPQLFESAQPGVVQVHTLHGKYARNKGMALFPRRIDGWYMMVGRIDGENIQLLQSDNVRFWNHATEIQSPRFPWQFVQIGNCGSPIETEAGWLLLTHGVGPMRRYCIGASLLDRDDPRKLLAQLPEPLLSPEADEKAGYVPNVVYSCGAMLHNGLLVIPYGISDAATGFATVPVDELLNRLR